jgi:4-hydroxy-tetrahydrodipicolinate reductase
VSAPLRLALLGATGRMGTSLLGCLPGFPGLALAAAVARADHPQLGQDAGTAVGLPATGVALTADLPAALATADLAIDFSSASATAGHLRACVAAQRPLLLGTTGLPDALQADLDRAAERIPLLVAANTSLGVALLGELVRRAAAGLPDGFDIEIVETHHRAKIDAPSGTALMLGAAAALGRGGRPEGRADARPMVHGPDAPGPRPRGAVGYASLRGGDVVGEHEVRFLGAGERLTLAHVATDRAVFARGALAAGEWLARQPPGRYQLRDLFVEK